MWVVHTGIVWCCTQHLCAAAYLEQCVGPLRPTLPTPLVHDSCLFIALSTSSNAQHGPLHCLLQRWHSCCLGQLLTAADSAIRDTARAAKLSAAVQVSQMQCCDSEDEL